MTLATARLVLLQAPTPPLDSPAPPSSIQPDLDRGFGLEQAGALDRALAAYRDALKLADSVVDRAQVRIRIARVLRALARWDEAVDESRFALSYAKQIGADDLAAEAL